MIPAAFDYEVAESVDHAISLLGQHGDDAKLIAGGHSLLPLMKLRLATPSVLIDVDRLDDLDFVRDGGDHVAIGARTRLHAVNRSELLAAQVPILAHAAGQVGDPQVRHRGTIGGSLAHADPASDLPAVMLALGGSFVAHGPNGERVIAARTSSPGSSSRRSSRPSWSPSCGCPRWPMPAGRSRSSTAGPSTGPSSAWRRCGPTAAAASAW